MYVLFVLPSSCLHEPARQGAYYAAQVGIALKPKETASRNFLFTLLGLLEQLKKDIGPSDAIDNDAVSSAYIENFALKIFAAADNEDRRGAATRCAPPASTCVHCI